MKRRTSSGTIAAIILTVIFGAALLLSIASGAIVYRHVAERVETSSRQRVGLSYITAKVHAAEVRESVAIGQFGGQNAVLLTVVEGDEVEEDVIYVYNRKLMELYCEDLLEFTPDDGEIICDAFALDAEVPTPGLLRLTFTDESGHVETADIYLRSGEEYG